MNEKEKSRLAKLLREAYAMPISIEKQAEFLLNNGVIIHAYDEGDRVYAMFIKHKSYARKTLTPGRIIKCDADFIWAMSTKGVLEVRETTYSKAYKRAVGTYVFETNEEAEKRKNELLEQFEKENE